MLLHKEQCAFHVVFIHFYPFENLCICSIGASELSTMTSALSKTEHCMKEEARFAWS